MLASDLPERSLETSRRHAAFENVDFHYLRRVVGFDLFVKDTFR